MDRDRAEYLERARQLLLPARERAAFVALACYVLSWGYTRCPSCGAAVERSEGTVHTHAQRCGTLQDDAERDLQW